MTAPYYLYRIRTPDGCSYMGVSWDHKQRFTEHCSEDSLVGLAIRYFGPDNCENKVLVKGPKDFIRAMEKRAILEFKTLFPDGYNCPTGRRWLSLDYLNAFPHFRSMDPLESLIEGVNLANKNGSDRTLSVSKPQAISSQSAGADNTENNNRSRINRDLVAEAERERKVFNMREAVYLRENIHRAIAEYSKFLDRHRLQPMNGSMRGAR